MDKLSINTTLAAMRGRGVSQPYIDRVAALKQSHAELLSLLSSYVEATMKTPRSEMLPSDWQALAAEAGRAIVKAGA